MLWHLLFDNSIWLQSLIQHPVILCGMLCRLQYQLFWNQCFPFCVLYCTLLRQSIVLIWSEISTRCLDCPIYKPKHCGHSVDAHYQDGVTKIACALLVEQDAITRNMNYCGEWHLEYQRCKTKNHAGSVDAHFQDGAGSLQLLLLALKVDNTGVMDVCNQSPPR